MKGAFPFMEQRSSQILEPSLRFFAALRMTIPLASHFTTDTS